MFIDAKSVTVSCYAKQTAKGFKINLDFYRDFKCKRPAAQNVKKIMSIIHNCHTVDPRQFKEI